MTSVEKRRSSRRSRGHRKHSNGGFSSSSNGGSFLDETDREVSNLTDRAFRSLCIGDEAVYNDSDLGSSSPSTQRDRQLAFSQDRAREEQSRAEQESFSLRVQQHGQEWIFGGTSGADIHRDPQWDVYGGRTQGMVSATFQHSFVGTSQQGKPLREGELSLFSNGASELSSQQRRSRSRVSSLVKAFNSDGHRDEAGMEDGLREWGDGTSWDRSALMSIQRELSEFSASYQQNLDGHQFPSANSCSQNTNFYSSQVGTAYLSSSHMKDSTRAQVNSNFFMHSEFSPFRLWRDHDRFPFQRGELSGFMQCSEFPKWYQTPVYNELSFANRPQDPYKDPRPQRDTQAPEAHSTHSISSSTVTQKSSAVEKRCESELAGHYPHMRWTPRLGANKLPSQRPSTASPTIEMSRRVRDTISSVKALQQKVKMMSVQNIATDETAHQQGAPDGRAHPDNTVTSAVTVEPNVFSSNTRSSFGSSQLLTPSVYAHQEAEPSKPHHCDVSPQPVEHPPVRAESRGATPDVRMSSYKSRATSLLFNLKDNRKRVKSTYSPTKFKGSDAPERNKQDPHETVIDIPAFSDPDIQEPRRTNAAANQYNPGQLDAQVCQPERTTTGQYPENTWTQTHGHAGFNSFIPGNYTNYQLANGQNPYEYIASFTPYKQDCFGSMEQLQQSYSAVDTARLNPGSNQSREYLIGQANTEQAFNETVGGVSSKVNRYERLIESKQNYKNASSREKWRQPNNQNTENVSLKTDIYPPNQEREHLLEQPRHENESRRKSAEKELNESLFFGEYVHQKVDLVGANVSNQLELERGQKANELKDGVLGPVSKYSEQDGGTQHSLSSTTEKSVIPQNTDQINQFMPELKKQENQSQQQIDVKQFEIHKKSSNPESLPTHQLKDRQVAGSKREQSAAENARDSKAEETKAPTTSQAQPLKTDSAELISSQKMGSENIRRGDLKLDPTKLERLGKAKQEEIKEEEQKEHFTKKELELDGDKETKNAQSRAEQLTDEPKCFTEKAENVQMTEEQAQVEQATTEELKGEHIRTDLPKTEEAEAEEPTRKKMNPEEEQLRTEPTEGEQVAAEQAENLNSEKVEYRKEEQQVKELQTKTKHVKITEDEVTETKTEVGGVREVEKNTDLSQVGQKTAENTTRPTCTVKDTKPAERKTKQAPLKETKLDRCRAELSTTENLLERSDHLTAKLTASQHLRREPDKVEQVKSELAKAKAELAKIKEKMRGEQKEKVKNNPVIKDDGASKGNTPSVHVDKNKDDEKQDQSDESPTREGADDRERLGEIRGFTNATNMSTGSVTSDDANEINEAGTENSAKLKAGHSLARSFIAANTENEKDVTETQAVHSESPKEFKPSNNSCPNNLCNEPNGDTSPDKLKTSGQIMGKSDSPINTTSLQRESHLEKLLPLQRKPESNGNRDPSKDVTITPARASSLKERAQTKQEILTSKIKAHAEKEISAIKEKGFALRDGFVGKSSTKHLASGQGVNVRQRPPSLDVPKNHENAVSNDALPKHQTEPSGTRTGPATFVPAQSCAATTRKFAAATAQLEHLEKSANQTENRTVCKNQNDEEQADHTDVPGKQNDERQQKTKGEILNERKEDQKQGARVEVVHDKSATAEVEIKEAVKMNSTPMNVVNASKETTETEDSLQIVGVVVTVRERKPSENVTHITGKTTAGTENECNKSELNKDSPSQGRDKSNILKEEETDEKKPLFKGKEDLAEVDQNSYLENVQRTSSLETKRKHKTRSVAEERTTLPQDGCKVNPGPQSETQPEPAAEKGASVSVTAPATDKTSETQTPLYKQIATAEKPKDATIRTATDIFSKSSTETKTDKERNQQQTQTAQINENFTRSAVDSKTKDGKAESLTKQLSVKEDTTVANIHQSSNGDGRSAPLQGEKGKTLHENPSMDSLQLNEKHSKDFQDVNVCIESIAIRVVPAVTKADSDDKSFSSDMKHQLNVPSSCEEDANASNNERCSKGFTLRSEKTDESLEDELAVQNVLSSVRKLSNSLKASSKPNSANTSSEGCRAENDKLESNMQSVEGDYFQIQGVTGTSSEAHGNKTTTEDKLKERELPGLLPNAAAISNKSRKEMKSEVVVFSLDQSKKAASSKITQEENIKKEKLEREATLAQNQTDGTMERRSETEKRDLGQSDPVCKRKEEQRHSSTVRRQSSMEPQPTKTNPVPEKPDVKPKPKGRTSTIPEISALADYARLKVIVAEDKDETLVQEFPRNKKDGFFPLIHTRHSRPPVFTEGPKELSAKEKLPNKTERSAKVNKEPKSILFPIVEKEHQRTGMFKLGDKDKQEEMVLDGKMNLDQLKSKDEYSRQKEMNKLSTQTELDQENNDLVHVQSKNRQVTASSFAASRTDNSSEVLTYLQPALGTENSTHSVKNVSPEMQRENETRVKAEDGRKGGLQQEKLTSQCKEIKTKLQDPKPQSEEEEVSKHEKEQSKEDIKRKNMIEERRASLAEEERRATRREEDRRAREREAVAIMIKERREKQRRVEIKAEEERTTKKREEENVLKKQEAEPVLTESDGRRTMKDERAEKLRENQNETIKQQKEERNVQEEQQQKRGAEEEQRKLVQVENQRRLAQEEHRRKYAQEEHQKGEAEENKQRAALKEQRSESVLEEQQRAAQGERQRKSLQEVQQKLSEEQQKRALEEQQRKAAQEEYKKKHALEELQRRADQEERQRKALQEEHQKKLEEEQRRAAQEEKQEEQQRSVAQMERQRKAAKEEKQEEQQRRAAQEEQQRRAEKEEQQRRADQEEKQIISIQVEQQRRAAQMERQRKAAKEENQRRADQEEKQRSIQVEQQRRAAQEEQQRRDAKEEQQRRAAQEEQQVRAAQEEKQRRAAKEEQQSRAAQEEKQRRAAKEEQQQRVAQEEQLRRTAQEEQQVRTSQVEQQRRAAQEEQIRTVQIEQQMRAAQEEQQRRAAKEEQQVRAAQEEKQRRGTKEEQQRRVAQEEQLRRTAQVGQQRRTAQEEQIRAVQIEQPMRAAQEAQQRRAAQEEQLRRTAQVEQQARTAQVEQQKRAAQEEQIRTAQIEQQMRAAQEEQQRRAAKEEQQRRAAQEEQLRRAAKEEQQRRAAQEEQLRRTTQVEQQVRTAQVEQQKRPAQEEQMRTAQIEQQMRAAQEAQQRRAAKEEQQRRAAQEEQLRRTAQVEQQVIDAQVEQQRRTAQEEQISALQKEQQNKVSQEEQQQRDVLEEQQSRDAQEEQQRRADQEEKQRRALHEQQRRAEHVEQQRRVEEEHQRKAVEEKQQRRSALIEERRQAKQIKEKTVADIQEETERKPREKERLDCYSEEERIKLIHDQGKVQQLMEEREGRWMKSDENRAAEHNILKQREEKQPKQESSVHLEKNMAAQELMLLTREKDAQAKKKEDERDMAKNVHMEKQKRAAQKMDALQYYAISSADTEKKLNERRLSSPLSSRKTIHQSVVEAADESLYHTRPHKPNAAASPAPPLPRSNTSSPALGAKPLMFRVKDNTFRGSTFTKSVKPRFHKNFGEDFWMGSPSERAEEEQETMRQSAGTPVSPEKGLNQFAPISEPTKVLSASPPDFSTSIPHQRPFSRRSMAVDDDESRSIISNMSEDVESFATSAADVADVRGLFDCDRPESACSFSSDASRSLGKPPTVPPKSEKALRRAQRLTSHRMKKERTKAAAGSLAGAENKVSSCPSSTEVCSSNHYAVASPHCSAPVAFAHAPSQGSSLPSSHAEHPSSHQSSHASPHATGPISLPISSPDAGSPPSTPSVSLHASNKASKPAAPKTIAHVSTSSTPHLTNPHSAPMAQYHVESSPYHQSYPLTQRKVLQDLGSGQYFLVDVPVHVKTKTFFDPETGKYVQLNVRQSGQNISRTQPQQTFPQAQLQPQMQIKSHQQPLSQASFAAKPFVLYQGYHSCPQSYQPAVINSVHPNRSAGHLQHHPGESSASTEGQQSSEGHRYSPEKTNYMDTVNDTKRTQDSNDSLSERNSNNQLTGSSVCEKDNATDSLCRPRDIITMSELEDFMEASDW